MSAPRIWAAAFVLAWGCSESSPAAAPSEPAPVEAPPEVAAPSPPEIAAPSLEPLDPPATPGSLGLALTASEDGLLATWIEPREGGHAARFSRRAEDSWSAPVTVAEGDDLVANWADFPRPVRGGDGAIFVHHLRRSGASPYAYEIRMSRAPAAGQGFASLGILHADRTAAEHGFVSAVPTDDGARFFWLDGRASGSEGGSTAVFTAAVTDAIGEEHSLDPRVCDCCATDAALTDAGPLLVYRDRSEGGETRDISAARVRGDEAASSVSVHADGWVIEGCPVNGPAVAASGSRAVAAWFTGADGGSVRLAFSDDGGASFGAPVEVDGRQPPGRVDVALLDDGAAVSWLGRSDDGAEVRVAFVSSEGRLSAPVTVARTLSARATGFPVMAHHQGALFLGWRDSNEPPRVHIARLATEALPRQAAPEEPIGAPRVAAGDALPEGAVRDADDNESQLSTHLGEGGAVVAFYASWCQPCREEMQTLEALRAAHPDTRVVAVSVDEGPHSRAEAVARRWGFEGPVLRDSSAGAGLGVPPLPGVFVVRDGRLRLARVGELADRADLERALEEAEGPAHTHGGEAH